MLPPPETPRAFLDFLHGERREGQVIIASKYPDRFTPHAFPVADLAGAATAVMDREDQAETYVSPALYVAARRTRDAVQSVQWLWRDGDDHPLGSRLPQPTLVIETSPGRTQELWRLVAPISAMPAEDLVRRIARVSGCGYEAVAANQVLRIPGTTNHGFGKNRAPVRVQVRAYAPYALYGPGSFAKLPPAPARPGAIAVTMPDLSLIRDEGAAWQKGSVRLSERMRALARGDIVPRRDGAMYASESEADQALMVALIGQGLLTDTEAAAAFLVTPRGQAMVTRKGARYLERRLARMVAKARAYVEAHPNTTRASTFPLDGAVVAAMPALGRDALAVAAALASFGSRPTPAVATLGKMVMLTEAKARRALQTLEQAALLTAANRFNQSRVYAFPPSTLPPVLVPHAVVAAGANLGIDAVAFGVILAAWPEGRNAAVIGAYLEMRSTYIPTLVRELCRLNVITGGPDTCRIV